MRLALQNATYSLSSDDALTLGILPGRASAESTSSTHLPEESPLEGRGDGLFVIPTATFQLLYGFVVLEHGRRRIRHVAVTAHPTAEWTSQQLREAFPWDTAPRFLHRDSDLRQRRHRHHQGDGHPPRLRGRLPRARSARHPRSDGGLREPEAQLSSSP